VVPAQATARFNIRFSDQYTGSTLQHWIQSVCDRHQAQVSLSFQISGEAESLSPGRETALLQKAIADVTGIQAVCTTKGATSDARFIRHYAPVVEFGLVGTTMHQVNEAVPLKDIHTLTEIYERILQTFCGAGDLQ
jgi:succinyl-diaminopimelate desuccinylase